MLRKDYWAKDKEAKASVRADKRAYIDSIAKETEEAANRGEQGTLYTLNRKTTNDTFRKSMPVKVKDGEEITSEADKIKR